MSATRFWKSGVLWYVLSVSCTCAASCAGVSSRAADEGAIVGNRPGADEVVVADSLGGVGIGCVGVDGSVFSTCADVDGGVGGVGASDSFFEQPAAISPRTVSAV